MVVQISRCQFSRRIESRVPPAISMGQTHPKHGRAFALCPLFSTHKKGIWQNHKGLLRFQANIEGGLSRMRLHYSFGPLGTRLDNKVDTNPKIPSSFREKHCGGISYVTIHVSNFGLFHSFLCYKSLNL